MNIPVFIVDAFSNGPFTGNPAAVCPLQEWLPDAVMQSIAAEHNLSETAFVVPMGDDFHIRWFTPAVEVDLCGHATLASAYVLFRSFPAGQERIRLFSRSGWLEVERAESGRLTLDFPHDPVSKLEMTPATLTDGLGAEIEAAYRGKFDYLVCVQDQRTVASLKPDLQLLGSDRFGTLHAARLLGVQDGPGDIHRQATVCQGRLADHTTPGRPRPDLRRMSPVHGRNHTPLR